ncbi:hypothetical protein B5S28_g3146 [[Candida] boidinii]|nr:hypothetical protein B5S28_g3146 [[Candida] boidinii]OWB60844.1 hypothetical protein B5S29_g1727 [[Candida] boidinii]OWB73824.1 hypothetical protein B5S31_g3588 [[Candida] boidinii]
MVKKRVRKSVKDTPSEETLDQATGKTTSSSARHESSSNTTEEKSDIVEEDEDEDEEEEEEEEGEEEEEEEVTILNHQNPHEKHHHHDSYKRAILKTKRFMFIFGTLFGVILALYFAKDAAKNTDLFNDLDKYVPFDTVSGYFEDWRDVLPQSLQNLLEETDGEDFHDPSESFAVGKQLKRDFNYKAKHPVVLVPGVISTGIESWGLEGTAECPSESHFRKRLWGSFYMLRTMFLDKTCWLKHIMLDHETGLDPEGIKLRSAQGFEAADFFMAGYWIWNKILQNLAVIGYGPDNMFSAAYDWRLSYLNLEIRDGYFTKLKSQIELNKKVNGEKTVLFGHSMGSQVIFYFLKWVEAEGKFFGNGGTSWVNDNIEAFVDISGCVLGTPKAIPALLSGEMKDTVQLNALAVQGLEKFFSRKERADMLRSFGGIASMLPKGGDLIWGNLDGSPDDLTRIKKSRDSSWSKLSSVLSLSEDVNDTTKDKLIDEDSKRPNGLEKEAEQEDEVLKTSGDDDEDVHYIENIDKSDTLGNFIRFTEEVGTYSTKNLTISESINFLLEQAPESFKRHTLEHYSYGISKNEKELIANEKDFNKWINPLEVPLPNAPDMKIFCFYGVGNPTERAYYYREEKDKNITKLNVTIEAARADSVLFSDGDGTVSLMTHAMCHKWAQGNDDPNFHNIYNPGNSKVTIVEIKHQPDRYDIRGGAKTAEHVDILGSAPLNELLLRVASGHGDTINNTFHTPLKDIIANLDF